MEEEKILRRIPLEIAVFSFIIALLSLLFFSPLTALFILAGGVFSAVSFIWLKQNISKLILLKDGGKSPEGNGEEKGTEEEEKGTGNFSGKKSSLSPFLPPSFKKTILSTLFFYSLRLVLILAIFFIIIFFFSKNIIAFIVGFSTVVPVFMVEAVSMLFRLKKWKV
jgi:hypothetical protein